MEKIIGRKQEIAQLKQCYDSGKPEMVIVYGRRRIGKTFLVRETFANQFDFYLTGLFKKSKAKQLENFANVLAEYSGEEIKTPKTWYDAFRQLKHYLSGISRPGRNLVFLDEVPWMATRRSDFVSALENFWNGWGSGENDVMLVVCGSATAWIMDKLLGDKGGLFNRDTERIYLEQFTLKETESYLQSNGISLSRHEVVECYMIMGGVPYYLSKMRKGMSLSQNIDNIFFKKNPLLKNEFEHLYNALFSTSETYIKIVEELSKTTIGLTREEIAAKISISSGGNLSRMLDNMINSDLIRLDSYYGHVKKDAVYQLSDFFTIFHFKYLKQHSTDENYWCNHQDSSTHSAWTGLAFEQVCFAHIRQIKAKLGITGVASEYYAWRNNVNGGAQIDLIIDRNDNIINLCEIKFWKKEFTLTQAISKNIENKIEIFGKVSKGRKTVHPVMITTYGLAKSKYNDLIQNSITLDDLFRENS